MKRIMALVVSVLLLVGLTACNQNVGRHADGIIKADKSSPEYKIVKTADKLAAYIKCLEELKSGNGEFKKAESQIKTELEKIDLPALRYFNEHFLESYSLTLDELDM